MVMNENFHQLEEKRTCKEMQTSLFIILVNTIINFNKNFIKDYFKVLLRLCRVYNAYAMFIQNPILGFSIQYYLNENINRLIVPYR